jgi:hypothetical protein
VNPSIPRASTAAAAAAAARNNADWCAAVCRSHGTPSSFGDAAWVGARRTPPLYPDAVTLQPDAAPAEFLPSIDTASPGCSVKDSFAALDLTAEGFVELFTAQWIHRPAGLPAPPTATPLRTEQVTTAPALREWQAAWHGDGTPPDVFRPELLDDPSVLVLAFREGDGLYGGAVANHSTGPVGLSNLFAVDGADITAVWSSAVTATAEHFPGRPLVGYEHEEDLAPALAHGFTPLGPLRVWLHAS